MPPNNWKLFEAVSGIVARPHDIPNADHLLVRPNLYSYVRRDKLEDVAKNGFSTIDKMIKDFPDQEDMIRRRYGDLCDDDIYRHSVLTYPCRIPPNLSTTRKFCIDHAPVRIVISRLKRSDSPVQFYSLNFGDDHQRLNESQLQKLTIKENQFFDKFENSKCDNLMDVPMVAIYCPSGVIPAFVCKVLTTTDQKVVR